MGGRAVCVLAATCVLLAGVVVYAMPPNERETVDVETRTKRGVKGGSRNTDQPRDGNGCTTFADGGYECKHSYGYGDSSPFTSGGDPNAVTSSLNSRDYGRNLVQAHVGNFDGDKNGCKTFPDGSYECRRGYSYSSSTHGWDALQRDPLTASTDLRSVLDLHGQDLAALRDGTGSFDRNQNGCRTFPDGSWECKRSWGYGSSTEAQTALNAGTLGRGVAQDYSDVRGGTGTIGRDQNGCRTFSDGSWECRRGYSYNSSTGWKVVSSDIPTPVSERRTTFNTQSASQTARASHNGGFDTTQKGCRTYADGSWECQPQWGYRPSTDTQTVVPESNTRERENIRNSDRNGGSRVYSSTQERQEVFSNSGASVPTVGNTDHSSNIRDSRVPEATPNGCKTLPDGTTECRQGYSYSSRQERNYTSGGLNALQPTNREIASRPRDVNTGRSSYSQTQERESVRDGGIAVPNFNFGLDTQVRESIGETSRSRLEETPVRSSYQPVVQNEPLIPNNRDHQRPVDNAGNVARHEYSYTHERESVRNGGVASPVDSPTVGSTHPRETVPNVYSSTVTVRPSSYSGAVVNSQNRGRVYQEPQLSSASRTSYSQTQQKEVIGLEARPNSNPVHSYVEGTNTHAREDFGDVSNVRVIPSYSRPATNPQSGDRDYRTPQVDSGVSGTRSYSYTQEKEVVNHGGIVNPNAGLGLSAHTSTDILGSTRNVGTPVGSGCQTNPDGSTVCRRGYSHSSTQEREVYSGGAGINPVGGRASDLILEHEEPGMVTVVSNPNARPNKEGCRTLPDGGTECVRGHSESRQWGHGVNAGVPIVNPFNSDGSVNHLGGSESLINSQIHEDLTRAAAGSNAGNTQGCTILPDGRQQCRRGYSYSATEERQISGLGAPLGGARMSGNYGSSHNSGREVEGVKSGRRTSSSSYSSSSQTQRVGGITNPTQNSGRYLNSESSHRQSAALQQGNIGQVRGSGCRTLADGSQACSHSYGYGSSSQDGSLHAVDGDIEVHNEQYVKSGSGGRGSGSGTNRSPCALIAGSPCNQNVQQSSSTYSSYGSTGFRTGTLEI